MNQTWKRYFSSLKSSPNSRYLADLALTLSSRRSHLQWRFYAVATETATLSNLADRMTGATRSSAKLKAAFIFTGQGSQWYAMGRQLINRYEVFKKSLVDAGAHLQTLGCKWNILGKFSNYGSIYFSWCPPYCNTVPILSPRRRPPSPPTPPCLFSRYERSS